MICPSCGTQIADNALVCYRCGVAASQPRPAARPEARSRSRVPVVLALLVLVAGALYLGQAPSGQIPRALSWSIAVLGIVVIGWLLVTRRRR